MNGYEMKADIVLRAEGQEDAPLRLRPPQWDKKL
jgi:hypothetical protein